MIAKSTMEARLCPYCANSIAEDVVKCPYCKADLAAESVPRWLNRGEPSSDPRVDPNRKKPFPIPAKFIWPAAMLVVALTAFFAGGYTQRSEQLLLAQAYSKQLQAKDQIIQSHEAQLAQTRKQLSENSDQLAELKTKLEASQKELSTAQQRLAVSRREGSTASRPATVARTASRAPDAAAPLPAPARRSAEPAVYETTRETSVYENPSSAARVISRISRGTRLNVVNSTSGWLEVRSRRGNPPGYVPSGDARPIGRVN